VTEIREFRIDIPQADLDDVAERLARVRWTNELPGAGNDYGVPLQYLRSLVERWRDGYDWRAWEARLNAHPPFHLVIPSIPGFGFSGPTTERGWDRYRIAKAWAELMRRLGYERYGVHGNDAGSLISPEVGRCDPAHVAGVHVTQVFSFPSGDPAEVARMSEEDRKKVEFLQWWMENGGAYDKLQSTAPQTLAHALADSPVGQLGWNAQLLGPNLDPDYVLTNTMIYWLTNTAASSARLYYEDFHAAHKPAEPTTVPLGLANFAWDFQSIRPLAERDHRNIVSWHVYETGSHFAAHDAPQLLVDDIRGFFRQLP
jgi:pimeloyl-ACP methyl ester carboxylesterase